MASDSLKPKTKQKLSSMLYDNECKRFWVLVLFSFVTDESTAILSFRFCLSFILVELHM